MGTIPVSRASHYAEAAPRDGAVASLAWFRSRFHLSADYRGGLIYSGAAFQTSDPTRDLDSLGHLRRVANRWGIHIEEAAHDSAIFATSFDFGCTLIGQLDGNEEGVRLWGASVSDADSSSPAWSEIADWLETSAEGMSNWSQRLGNHVAFREMSPQTAGRIQRSGRREHLRLVEARKVAAEWCSTQAAFVGGRAGPILLTAADRLRRASDLLAASSRLVPDTEGWSLGAREGQARALGQVRFLERQAAGSIRTLIELIDSN